MVRLLGKVVYDSIFGHGPLVALCIIGGFCLVIVILVITGITSPWRDALFGRRKHRFSTYQRKRYIKSRIKYMRQHKIKNELFQNEK